MDRPRRAPPRFFLAQAPGPPPVRSGAAEAAPRGGGARAALLPEEALHARRVLRLAPGDRALGLDGEGHAWPLVVAAAGARGELVLEVAGEPRTTAAYGEPGAVLPWIELAVAWPRRARAEEMIGRLVQLGAAAITPLQARFTSAEPCPVEAPERWHKLAREACKQSRRAWLPRFHPASTPAGLAGRLAGPDPAGSEAGHAALAVLEPAGGMALDTWVRSLVPGRGGIGSRARPIVLAVGPEGGFHPLELDALLRAGATPVRLGPHVLRVETAAEAALAVAACILAAPLGEAGGAPDVE